MSVINVRRAVLALGLIVAVCATVWVTMQDQPDEPRSSPSVAKGTSRAPRTVPAAAVKDAEAVADLPLDLLNRGSGEKFSANLFPVRSWQPPPKSAAKAGPPPPPMAPPLPFTAFGQMIEGGRTTVFLNGRDRSYAVKAGDVLDKTYRVDTIREGAVVLTYLPLNQQQTLQTGAN